MVRLENLELEHREEAQQELLELADLLRARGLEVEVADLDESSRSRLEESAESVAVDVLNVVLHLGKDVTVGVVSAVVLDWARRRKRFRGNVPDDRPQARFWVVEDGREYDYAVDLDDPSA